MNKKRQLSRIKGKIFSSLLRLQGRTWQVHVDGLDYLDQLYFNKNRFLICLWHGKYVPVFALLEGYNALVVTNRSTRGNVIAEVCRNFGYQTTRIPDQSGQGAFDFMAKALTVSESRAVGVAVDGPLGPRHIVKNGVIRIASAFGFVLLPASVDSRRKIVFKKRWDRMEIPLPFTRIGLVFGMPITVPPEVSSRQEQVSMWADKLAGTISRLDKKAEDMAYTDGIK
ncbi:lysophospholipid acyltransferase family protein [Desulfobacula sp.]